MITNTDRERVLGILRATERPGIEAVINYIETSNYFTQRCHGHHKECGGLAAHSLEVYDHMCAHAGGLSADSIAVTALLHDLGKTRRRDRRGLVHDERSVEILDELGFALTDDERISIGRHHHDHITVLTCPLRRALTWGDCNSARTWKLAHPDQCGHRGHDIRKSNK